jgi:hypothetical protein
MDCFYSIGFGGKNNNFSQARLGSTKPAVLCMNVHEEQRRGCHLFSVTRLCDFSQIGRLLKVVGNFLVFFKKSPKIQVNKATIWVQNSLLYILRKKHIIFPPIFTFNILRMFCAI